MNQIKKLMMGGFESSSFKTPQFTSFARKFKHAFAKELAVVDAHITAYNVGHFYISGFFRRDGVCYYFSLSDVRCANAGGHWSRLLYRIAKDEKDFTGGINQYAEIEPGMAERMRFRSVAA